MAFLNPITGWGGRDKAVGPGPAQPPAYLPGRGGVLPQPDGVPDAEPTGNMIVDIGGGTTEVAVISLGGIVVSQSLRVGGDEMDEAIVNHIKREYKLLVGQQTAEEIKLEIGSAFDMRDELQAEVRGRDMLTGLPKTVILSSEEVRRAPDEPASQIIEAIQSTPDKTTPHIAAD